MPGNDPTISQAGEVRSARIESIRALAALGVLAGHVYGQSRNYNPALTLNSFWHRTLLGGGLGVFVFFGLTGYLLYWPFARAHFGAGGRLDLGRYAINRVLRIVPLYVAATVILLLLRHDHGSLSQWWRFLTFSENYSIHTVGTVDGPMWSLVVEVHFYLLLPLLAWGLGAIARNSKMRAAVILVGLAALSYIARHHAVGTNVRRPLLEFSLPSGFMFFVPGMLIALLRLHWEERRPSWLRGPLAIGDWWLAAAAVFFVLQCRDYSNYALIAITTFLAIGACVLPLQRGRVVGLLDWRPLAVVGVASYSIYIWHNPLVIWLAQRSWLPHSFSAQLLIVTAVTIPVALVSYRLIEAPFLRLRRRWTTSRDGQTVAAEATAASISASA